MLRRFPARVRNILDCYRNVAINGPRDIREWHVYLRKFPDQYDVHHQHLLETRYFMALALAEKAMFQGLVAWQNNDRKFRIGDKADRYLLLAISRFKAAMVAFHTYLHVAYPRTAGFPKGMGRGGQMKFMRAKYGGRSPAADGRQEFKYFSEGRAAQRCDRKTLRRGSSAGCRSVAVRERHRIEEAEIGRAPLS